MQAAVNCQPFQAEYTKVKERGTMAPTPPLPVTEDTPPDMLAGSMDLRVILPTGNSVKMCVERSTPMMDLLVQVTTVNKLSTGSHILQALGERGILSFKPSTPIGALDTWTIQVIPKSKTQTSTVQKKAPLKPQNQQQPFEQTFRLQVHLPRNQLFVMRVGPRTLLYDILQQTCMEKNLDPNKYEMRHPADLSQLLNLSCTLADYGLQEVTMVTRSSRTPGMGSALSSSDIMALQREEDKRRQQARQQHGNGSGLGLVFNKRNQSSVCEGSVSSDSLGGRSISPARSDDSVSRSASPPAPSPPPMMTSLPPARPARKRRPAPKPPSAISGSSETQQIESKVQAESSSGIDLNSKKTTQVPISHSRNSSDSSGYHEASVLSDSPAESQQMSNCSASHLERTKTREGNHGLSRSMSSLTTMNTGGSYSHSVSNTSLASSSGQGQKKKKAPPPPPGVTINKDEHFKHPLSLSEPHKTTSLERHLSGKSSAVGSHSMDKCSTLPGKIKMPEHDYGLPESQDKLTDKAYSSEERENTSVSQNIPELEENASGIDNQKELSPVSLPVEEFVSNVKPNADATIRNVNENLDEPNHQLSIPPVEIVPQLPVESAASSKSSDVGDKLKSAEMEDFEVKNAVDQVEEAFRSVTEELEADEELNTLLPPLPATGSSAYDINVEWEYHLPAPPSAFRDMESPALTEGTIALGSTQVFDDSSSLPGYQESATEVNTTTTMSSTEKSLNEKIRINPVFDPHQNSDDDSDIKNSTELRIGNFKNDNKILDYPETSSQERYQSVMVESESKSLNSWVDLNDQRKDTFDEKGVCRGGELSNFTITTYEKPRDAGEFFNEDSDDDRYKSVPNTTKKSSTQLHQKYGSTNSLNTNGKIQNSVHLSRTNSFNQNDNGTFKVPDPQVPTVKKSTSYISLTTAPTSHSGKTMWSNPNFTTFTNRTNSVGNLINRKQSYSELQNRYDSWNLRKTTSETRSDQNEQAKPQTAEERKTNQDPQKKVVMTEEEHTRLLALQEQFLQLQEQLMQNSNLLQQQSPQQQQQNLQETAKETPLQSLQVLRNILPQLNQTKTLSTASCNEKQDSFSSVSSSSLPSKLTTKKLEDTSSNESEKETSFTNANHKNNNQNVISSNKPDEIKKYKYQGPPAINFATWNERPKSQVSIKMDRDYRIGIGQGGRTDGNDTPSEPPLSANINKQDAAKLSHFTNEHGDVGTSHKPNSHGRKVEPPSLTMRLITQTNSSDQKFGAGEAKSIVTETKETGSVIGMQSDIISHKSDSSRVPIVRAVELKKSFLQQQNISSNPHSYHRPAPVVSNEQYFDVVNQRNVPISDKESEVKTFIGVNSLTKRFSFEDTSTYGPSSLHFSQPVSAYGTTGFDSSTTLPYNNTLSHRSVSSTNLNSSDVNTHKDPMSKSGNSKVVRRYTSVVGINNSDHSLQSNYREQAQLSSRAQPKVSGSSVVKVNSLVAPKQLMPVVKGFQFTSAAANRDTSPPPSSRRSNAINTKVHRSESTSAIRNWKTADTNQSHTSNFNNMKAYLRQTSNESQSQAKIPVKATNSVPPVPPSQATFLRKTAQTLPKSLPVSQPNPRDQLMDAIRNFGGRENLKQNGRS